ncbi:unnamed protein product [Leuciscus chuanchicus]
MDRSFHTGCPGCMKERFDDEQSSCTPSPPVLSTTPITPRPTIPGSCKSRAQPGSHSICADEHAEV